MKELLYSFLLGLVLSLMVACGTTTTTETPQTEPDDGIAELIAKEDVSGEIEEGVTVRIEGELNLSLKTLQGGLSETYKVLNIEVTLPSGKKVKALAVCGSWREVLCNDSFTDNSGAADLKVRQFTTATNKKVLAGVVMPKDPSNSDPMAVLIARNSLIESADLLTGEVRAPVRVRLALAGTSAAGVLTEQDSNNFIGVVVGETNEQIRVLAGDKHSDDVFIVMQATIDEIVDTKFGPLLASTGTMTFRAEQGNLDMPFGSLIGAGQIGGTLIREDN